MDIQVYFCDKYVGNMSTHQQTAPSDIQDSRVQSLHSSIDTLQRQLSELQSKLNSPRQSKEIVGGVNDEPVEEANQDRNGGKEVEEGQERRSFSNVQEALRRRYGEGVGRNIDDQDKP